MAAINLALAPEIVEELWSKKALRHFLSREGLLFVDGFVMHMNFVDHLDEDCTLWLIGENAERMRFPGPLPGTRFERGDDRPFSVRGWQVVYPEIPEDFYPQYHEMIRAASQLIKGTKYRFVHMVGSDEEADEYVREMRESGKNIIPLGIGTVGPFNEHGQGEEGRARGDCASLRVARWAGLHQEQCYRPIIREIVRADEEATQRLFELGRELKRGARLGADWEEILHMTFTRLEWAARESSRMMACADEFDRKRGWLDVGGVKVALIVSDSPSALTFLRWLRANIVVKFTCGKDGQRNVLIQCRKGVESRRWFVEIAMELCRRECQKKNMSEDEVADWVAKTRVIAEKNHKKDMAGAEEYWCLFEQQLMNGTFSHVRQPTRLLYAEIVDIIVTALGRIPPRGDMGQNLREVEMHLRKILELMSDSGEGEEAAGEANLPDIEHKLTLAMQAVARAKRGDKPTEPGPVIEGAADSEPEVSDETAEDVEDSEEEFDEAEKEED